MYCCPKCGSISLEVVVEVWATLIQNAEGFERESTDWHPMTCGAVAHACAIWPVENWSKSNFC
jgi:hypothetical protein